MIKIDNLKETSVNEMDSPSYKDIKPIDHMSDAEVADCISKEFESARDVTEFDTYDKLISDVFNRSEEDVDVDFSCTGDILSLLENFTPDKWESMNDSGRIESLNELAQAIGKALGIKDIPEINIAEADDRYGFFDPNNNSITLNIEFIHDPIELINTLAHEFRHAYQHMRAEILETREDALFKVNFDNYITPVPLPEGGWLFFTDYYNQYLEVDARAFADKFTEAMI